MVKAQILARECMIPSCPLWFSSLIWSPKTFWEMDPSKITIERPAKMEDTKKRMGMNSEYHRGWIFSEHIR